MTSKNDSAATDQIMAYVWSDPHAGRSYHIDRPRRMSRPFGTAMHEMMERSIIHQPSWYQEEVTIPPERTWMMDAISDQAMAIMSGYEVSFLKKLRKELNKAKHTPAWMRTHSKRKRAGMRRTRRMMAR